VRAFLRRTQNRIGHRAPSACDPAGKLVVGDGMQRRRVGVGIGSMRNGKCGDRWHEPGAMRVAALASRSATWFVSSLSTTGRRNARSANPRRVGAHGFGSAAAGWQVNMSRRARWPGRLTRDEGRTPSRKVPDSETLHDAISIRRLACCPRERRNRWAVREGHGDCCSRPLTSGEPGLGSRTPEGPLPPVPTLPPPAVPVDVPPLAAVVLARPLAPPLPLARRAAAAPAATAAAAAAPSMLPVHPNGSLPRSTRNRVSGARFHRHSLIPTRQGSVPASCPPIDNQCDF
jgi:hypothetical protein